MVARIAPLTLLWLDVVPVLRNWRRVPLSPNRILFHRDRKIANARHLILGTWRVQYP